MYTFLLKKKVSFEIGSHEISAINKRLKDPKRITTRAWISPEV